MADQPLPNSETTAATTTGYPVKSGLAAKAPDARGVLGDQQAARADRALAAGTARVAEGYNQREEIGLWMQNALRQTPSWLVSAVVHMIILLILALLTLPEGTADDLQQLLVAPGEEEEFDNLEEFEEEPLEEINVEVMAIETEVVQEEVHIPGADDMGAAGIQVKLDKFGLEHAPRGHLLDAVGAYSGDGLSSRGSGKGRLVRQYGGSQGSEKAVAAALHWLAEHQMHDGGWSFNHTVAPNCGGRCRDPGSEDQARIGATAMAVLPFLGAGQTHRSGKYKSTVEGGLYFLIRRMKVSPKGGSLWEQGGRMYAHGLASIALCEAYAMTHDKNLHAPAQAAINFICYAQDPVGGGWRYNERQRGDTSVVGWQIMALKSGHMAYLQVPRPTVRKAEVFLDSVQANSGANYGYTGPGDGQATTAIGLLCRMYLGWKKDNPALRRGVQWLSNQGPSKSNMYYNYYATQVMRHWEGDLWKKWNSVMRDQLVNSQAKIGHEKGSWHVKGDHGSKKGGRLYCTSMAAMVLEVYYRHLPIYRKQSTEEDFPE